MRRQIYFNPNISLLYAANPKSASTALSIATSIASRQFAKPRYTWTLPEVNLLIDPINTHNTDIGSPLYQHLLKSNRVFAFTFVRNPYSRLLSAYLDKIRVGYLERQFVEAAEKTRSLAGKTPEEEVSFGDFVNMVATERPTEMNSHWRIQSTHLEIRNRQYDFIGRVERIDEDIRLLFNHSSQLETVTKSIGHHGREHKTDASFKLMDYYTPELTRKVYEIYRDDFEIFGYYRELGESSSYDDNLAKLPRAPFKSAGPSLYTRWLLTRLRLRMRKERVTGPPYWVGVSEKDFPE